jgi:twinkle protein
MMLGFNSIVTTVRSREANSMTAVNEKILGWLERRGISPELSIRMGIYSGARVSTGDDQSEVVAREDGNIVVFPFIDGGKTVGEKYRAAGKRFWQRPNCRKTFFNADIMSDPALAAGEQALVITEGEIDCLSAIEAGYPFVVSVPDGAPPARDKNGKLIEVPETTAGIDPESDEKYSFIPNNWDRLAPIKKIVLATDGDEPGRRLAAELVRRLGRVRCYFISYPETPVCDDGNGGTRPCKDFNEVLLNFGAAEIIRMIAAAQPYPVSGVYRLSNFPPEPEFRAVSSGWGRLDEFLMLYHPAFMVVTGFAGAGKSSWANQLVANLALNQHWGIAIASFEMRVRPYVTDVLASVRLSMPRHMWSFNDRERAGRWMEESFVFIAPDPDDDESTHDIEWLLSRAETAVIRHGVRVLLIDPWNEIEHVRNKDETTSDYTGRAIRLLKSFGRKFDCLVIVVAHPTKSGTEKGPDRVSLYDISDSAHFANKADLGVVIARKGDPQYDFTTSIMVKKVRYQPDAGRIGSIDVTFDPETRLFSQ